MQVFGYQVFLVRSRQKSIPKGTVIQLNYEPANATGRLYLIAEVGHLGRDGGFPTSLRDQYWMKMDESMVWLENGKKRKMVILHTDLSRFSGVIRLPPTTTNEFVGSMVLKIKQ